MPLIIIELLLNMSFHHCIIVKAWPAKYKVNLVDQIQNK